MKRVFKLSTALDANLRMGRANESILCSKRTEDTYESNLDSEYSWDDLVLLPDAFAPSANTLLGPPKEYFGNSMIEHRAYMLFEAISMLKTYGFFAIIPRVHKGPTTQTKTRFLAVKNQKVPGLLGFLMDEISPSTKIPLEDHEGNLIAYIGFVASKNPWLNVLCVSSDESTAKTLTDILSKRFTLTNLRHEKKCFPPVDTTRKLSNEGKQGFTVKMVTGTALKISKGHTPVLDATERLLTKFSMEKHGKVVARSVWSFENHRLNVAGPTMELFEMLESEWRDLDWGSISCSLLLSTMEEIMIHNFSPLVSFRLNICCVNDPYALQWLSKRGYTAVTNNGGTDLCKAFCVF
jgi:hypothetical protein